MKKAWVYILLCSNNRYYTGVTSNLEKRIDQHENGNPKCYTTYFLPVKLVYSHAFESVEDAIRAEKKIKGWTRAKKDALINNDFSLIHQLSECQNKTHSKFYKNE